MVQTQRVLIRLSKSKLSKPKKMDEEPNAADRFGATLLFWGVVASFPVVFGTFVYFGIALAFAVF